MEVPTRKSRILFQQRRSLILQIPSSRSRRSLQRRSPKHSALSITINWPRSLSLQLQAPLNLMIIQVTTLPSPTNLRTPKTKKWSGRPSQSLPPTSSTTSSSEPSRLRAPPMTVVIRLTVTFRQSIRIPLSPMKIRPKIPRKSKYKITQLPSLTPQKNLAQPLPPTANQSGWPSDYARALVSRTRCARANTNSWKKQLRVARSKPMFPP